MKVFSAIKDYQTIRQQQRDLEQTQAAKDFLGDPENADLASSPEKQQSLMAINPAIGMAYADHAGALQQQIQQRAESRFLVWDNAASQAHKAYADALGPAAPQGPEDAEAGLALPNYNAADRAGNDSWQRSLKIASANFGPAFASKLRPIWRMDDYVQDRPAMDAVLQSMRKPVNLVHPDGSAETVPMLQSELNRYLQAHPGTRVTNIGTGAEVAGGAHILSDAEAKAAGLAGAGQGAKYQRDAKGALTPVVGPEVVSKQANELGDRFERASGNYLSLRNDYLDGRKAAAEGTRAGDITLLTKWLKMHNPGVAVAEGSMITAQQAATLPPALVALYNKVIGANGELQDQDRRDVLAEMGNLYSTGEQFHAQLRPEFEATAKAQVGDEGAKQVMGRVPFTPEIFKTDPLAPKPPKVLPPAAAAKVQEGRAAAMEAGDLANMTLPELVAYGVKNQDSMTAEQKAEWNKHYKRLRPEKK